MFAIARKDLKVVSQNKNVLIPIIIITVIFFVALPWLAALIPSLINVTGDKLNGIEEMLARMPGSMQQEFMGYTFAQKIMVVFLVYMMLPLFLLLPVMVASLFAADSFAGEKERKTLEALLYTPTSDRELLIAKLLSGWLAAIAVALVGFLLYTINVNAAAWSQMHRIFFPNAMWLVMMLWVIPALSGLGVAMIVLVSSRAQGFQDANQMGGIAVLPIIALFYAQVAGAMFFNTLIVFVMGLIIWLLTALLIWLGSRTFRRNRLLGA
jgi:ABC-type Na+ efflux pump permease subunit